MKTLFIIDAYNLLYRMFYAIPEMNTRDGKPVNAIFGVAKFLKGLADENPDASLVVANDVGRSFREKLFSEYKAQRDRMPDNLRSQIEWVFGLFHAAWVPVLSQEGYEADDIIGSLAIQHKHDDYQVVIISSDKDLCQFVIDGKVHIYDAMKRKFMKRVDVIEKFGVPPEQVCDYLAIVWDASDNIPGISWFGPKKAVDLLSKYNTLEGIYEELWIKNYELWKIVEKDEEKYNICDLSEKLKQWLIDNIENAFLSQKLASIVTDLTVEKFSEVPFASWVSKEEYIALLKSYEFRSLLPKGYEEEKKKVAVTQAIEITTLWALADLLSRIERSGKIFLATGIDTPMSIWIDSIIYTIDPKQIDLSEFTDKLFSLESLEITWYDLKEDYKRLLAIQKPLEHSAEGQGRLF